MQTEGSSELSTGRWACQHSGVRKQGSWKRKGRGGGREIRRGLVTANSKLPTKGRPVPSLEMEVRAAQRL